MPFKNRIRLPFYLSKPQFPVERNVFRNAVGATTLLTATVRNTYEGKTDQLPEDWHRKLVIALVHKEVTIEDNRLLTDVVIDGEYGIDWQDFLNYPIAPANFIIQVTPFNASSNNCQSCSEITQLSLVDDYSEDTFEQGTTNEYPDIIANDNICCYPFTVEIISFNTLYFESVTLNLDNTLTIVLLDEVPPLEDVLIATYRVTCENGGYDEANVYGNINGTGEACLPATNVQYNPIEGDTNLYFTWNEPTPVPSGGYDWAIYLESSPYLPIASGNTSANNLTVNGAGFVAGLDYIFVITSDCGELFSTPVQLEFMYETAASNCGSYQFYYVPVLSDEAQSVSYMDCFGQIQNYVFTYSHSITRCCLETSEGVPVFITASTTEISITYIEPC